MNNCEKQQNYYVTSTSREIYIILFGTQYLRQLSGFELNGYVMNTEGCNPQKPYESSFELNEYVMNTTH